MSSDKHKSLTQTFTQKACDQAELWGSRAAVVMSPMAGEFLASGAVGISAGYSIWIALLGSVWLLCNHAYYGEMSVSSKVKDNLYHVVFLGALSFFDSSPDNAHASADVPRVDQPESIIAQHNPQHNYLAGLPVLNPNT